MMYHSDSRVLSLCKRMQCIEGDYFVICQNGEIRHCTGFDKHAIDRAMKSEPGKMLRMEPSSFDACIKNLTTTGMIRSMGPVCQVTHDGWNQREVIRRERLTFVMTHALFPSFVSIATTSILWLIRAIIH